MVSIEKHETLDGCARDLAVVTCRRQGHIFPELNRAYKNELLMDSFESRLLAVWMQLQ